jgi:dolichol-phosphate mannosyltransferase
MMPQLPSISLVVPTYNERDRLPELVAAIFGVLNAHDVNGEVIVVDDNSPDGTGDLAQALSQTYPIQLVRRPGKLGLGTAVVAGFAVARGQILGVLDADLSHPPALLPEMLKALDGGADFVVGSRYVPGGGTRGWSASRIVMSRLACWLARPLTDVRDATSGFFLVRRHVVEHIQIKAGGFKICLEFLVRGRARSIAEIPYVFVGRTAGQSKMNLWEALGYLKQLRQLTAAYRTRALPRPGYTRTSPSRSP